MAFWVKFTSYPASGRPNLSRVVSRSAEWESDPYEGLTREQADDHATFFGPFATLPEAEAEERHVWDTTVVDAEGYVHWA